MKSFIDFINEDLPINNVSAGNIAGIAPGETPPIKKNIQIKLLKRKSLQQNAS